MKLSDFESLVQLGVGIHAGTAFFSMLNEIQLQPIAGRIAEVEAWLKDCKSKYIDNKRGFYFYEFLNKKNKTELEIKVDELIDKLNGIRTSIKICRIQHFNEFKKLTKINFSVGGLLLMVLVVASFCPDAELNVWTAILLSGLCFCPALWSFIRLWRRGRDALAPALDRLAFLEAIMRGEDV
ncbi:hypothetical protein GJ654_01400 [Rhodoblastus acidophilus]|uniref:Uncharacterized protein n=1 Tax=Rhodoblastus acidophilus TaxID=1074 RepID=A0A6N8DKC7_RHOAC|nr:hypothetical protein [Rhodoblastus acidophilus]MCW2272732.1 hypothetical protein [Rhodoblastus acidophilus]MTV29643.1 hypothetical protein [Rhodoblastus acidophilus]